jgi:hypothetical protein
VAAIVGAWEECLMEENGNSAYSHTLPYTTGLARCVALPLDLESNKSSVLELIFLLLTPWRVGWFSKVFPPRRTLRANSEVGGPTTEFIFNFTISDKTSLKTGDLPGKFVVPKDRRHVLQQLACLVATVYQLIIRHG